MQGKANRAERRLALLEAQLIDLQMAVTQQLGDAQTIIGQLHDTVREMQLAEEEERKAAFTESNALRQQLQRADDRLYHSKPCNRQKRAYTTVDKKLSTSQSKAARSDLWARNIVLVARNADLEHHVQRLQVAVGQRQELQDEAALLSIQMERRQRRAV